MTKRTQTCDHCAQRLAHWIWRYVGDGLYIPMCQACADGQAETFTPLGAIQQANAITMLYHMLHDAPARYKSAVAR